MSYDFYLDDILLPVAPSKLQLKIKNQNTTLTLINEGEINILKKAGLTEASFTVDFPQVQHPHARYINGFVRAETYLEKLEALKVNQKPFQFIISRTLPNGKILFDTNMKVALEDYTITEDKKQGFDIEVAIKLKQYKDYATKTIEIVQTSTATPEATVQEERANDSSVIAIGSSVIVNGRLHRDSYGKGPGQTRANYVGKINFIKAGRSHPYHVTTPSGSWLGWVVADAVKAV